MTAAGPATDTASGPCAISRAPRITPPGAAGPWPAGTHRGEPEPLL